MPVTPTYPGVYIEEIPSGVRTITGVATSITAFVGRTARGPANAPTEIFSFADFERTFGGLHADLPLSYAVRDFYRNGGGQALIVRLFNPPAAASGGVATIDANGLKLAAASAGKWGDALRVRVVHPEAATDGQLAARYGLPAGSFFDLLIFEEPSQTPAEVIRNLTVIDGPRRADRVLLKESSLVRVALKADGSPNLPAARPDKHKEDDPTDKDRPTAGSAADSDPLEAKDYLGLSDAAPPVPLPKAGLRALDKADLFNILCIPPDKRAELLVAADEAIQASVYQEAMAYCATRRAMLIVDAPLSWAANKETAAPTAKANLGGLGLSGTFARNAALYFPWVTEADPLRESQPAAFAPSGMVAGIYARTDRERGVWKAPAGLDAALNGITGLQVSLNDDENGLINPLGINCLRAFPVNGRVVWGARTLRGADQLADEYKYVPVRRTALFIEESLYRGTQWVVFEPNDEPLWAQIRLNVGAFMQGLFRQGAFQGRTPREAYLVKCDKETTTQNDINLGIVNIVVGFAPLKPAEFVIIKIQQLAGQIEA